MVSRTILSRMRLPVPPQRLIWSLNKDQIELYHQKKLIATLNFCFTRSNVCTLPVLMGDMHIRNRKTFCVTSRHT